MRDATLCFLVQRDEHNQISQVCLAMKKRGWAEGKWNGAGGKVEEGETIEQAMAREVKEEIGVIVREYKQAATIDFTWEKNPENNQVVHVYVAHEWLGEPTESEEMRPRWFDVSDVPYDGMWIDDQYWLPLVLQGKTLTAAFHFEDFGVLLNQEVVETGFFLIPI